MILGFILLSDKNILVEIGHELIFTVILSQSFVSLGMLSVSGSRLYTD